LIIKKIKMSSSDLIKNRISIICFYYEIHEHDKYECNALKDNCKDNFVYVNSQTGKIHIDSQEEKNMSVL
jgi:hypothetical protein